jgi:hypothetical protein
VQFAGTGADGDGDGRITEADYPVWKLHFGNGEDSGSLSKVPIPEPSTFWSIAVAATLVAARLRRRN